MADPDARFLGFSFVALHDVSVGEDRRPEQDGCTFVGEMLNGGGEGVPRPVAVESVESEGWSEEGDANVGSRFGDGRGRRVVDSTLTVTDGPEDRWTALQTYQLLGAPMVNLSPDAAFQVQYGPNPLALEWLKAAHREDIDAVWTSMTADFRLVCAQGWIMKNPQCLTHPTVAGLNREAFAAQLADTASKHPLFLHLARVTLREIRNAAGNFDPETLGIGTRPRPIGSNLELVRLLVLADLPRDDDGVHYWPPDTPAYGASVIMQHEASGWFVAGVGAGVMAPGWPPTLELEIDPGD